MILKNIKLPRVLILLFTSLVVVPHCIFPETGKSETGYTPQSLYELALENNIDLQMLNVERNQAVIDRNNAKASMFPSVDFEATLSYISNPLLDPITVTAGQFGSYNVAGETILIPPMDAVVYDGLENTYYNFNFIIEQPVYTWGKIKNSIKLYENIAEVSGNKIDKNRNEIRTKINIYTTTLYYILKIEEGLENQLEDADRLIKIAEDSFENGFILYADLLNARIQAKEVEIAVAELREQKAQAILALQQLSGVRELNEKEFDFSFVTDINELEIDTAENYFKKAVAASSEVRMLNSLRKINELRLQISEGSDYFKPDIGLHLEIGYAGPRFPFIETGWFGEDGVSITSTIALQSTIYDGGKTGYDIKKNTEELNKAIFQYENGLNSLEQFISETVLKIELNKKNIEYFRLKQENDRQQIDLRKTQFEAGSGNESDLIKERINLNSDLIKEYKESIDFYKNYFSVTGLLGSV